MVDSVLHHSECYHAMFYAVLMMSVTMKHNMLSVALLDVIMLHAIAPEEHPLELLTPWINIIILFDIILLMLFCKLDHCINVTIIFLHCEMI